jgi:hypothetical protein
MKRFGALIMGVALVGCGGTEEADLSTDLSSGSTYECSWVHGSGRKLILPATDSQNAETYAIWNLGNAVIDAEYDTDRPDLLMVIPGWEHTVPGFEAFDHDHVMSHGPGDAGYNATWDVFLVVPGPNFNPATYTRVKSMEDVARCVSLGVLAGPIRLDDAGFPNLVLRAPLASSCTPAPQT